MLAVQRSELVIIVQDAFWKLQGWHWRRFLEKVLLALVIVVLPDFVDVLHVVIVVLDLLVVSEGVLQSGKTVILLQLLFVLLEPHGRGVVARGLLFLVEMLHLLDYLLLGLSPGHDLVELHFASVVVELEESVNFSMIFLGLILIVSVRIHSLIDVALVCKAV